VVVWDAMHAMTVWVAGGSGLVGGELLSLLLADDSFGAVVSVGRRNLPLTHPRLQQAIVDFAAPSSLESLPAPDAAFCCLGTTIGRAGSREAFRAVDHDAVVAFAKAARQKGARHFLHVTALGADAGSRVFYNAVKGQAEDSVAGLGFEGVAAFQPSILDGDRAESRPMERVGLAVTRTLGPLLGKYRPTPVSAVAAAMIAWCKDPRPGRHVVGSKAILAFRPGSR
jgi:uncharacterized protein YbjT (DUF2867 family)